MVNPLGSRDFHAFQSAKIGSGLTPEQTKQLDSIIAELEQHSSPPWSDAIDKIQALINSNPPLSPRASNLLNQALDQLESGGQGMLPFAIQSLHAIENKVTLSPQQAAELQNIINEIKNGQPPYTKQIQELNAFLNSQPPLSPYEKDCVSTAIDQLGAGGMTDEAVISLNSLQSESTLTPDQIQQLEDIINGIQSGSPPYSKEEQAIKELMNSQPPLSPYEKDCLNDSLGQLEAGGMTQAAIVSLQNLLPM